MQTQTASSGLPFMKMHGLGNDFVVIHGTDIPDGLSESLVRAIAHRNTGVGFDQLTVIAESDRADARLVFYNADGSLSATCGNATRCIARHLMDVRGVDRLVLETERGLLPCEDAGNGLTRVNMGAPLLAWDEIPIAQDIDTLHLPIDGDPVGTGMGNPHCTFFVADAEAVDLATFGPPMEHHPLFPQRTNVQVAHLIGPDHLRMRVWERGTGITMASGSSSCATAVAAARRGITGRKVRISLDIGDLVIDWREDGVWMEGPTAHVFSGTFTREFLEAHNG
ncbi:diaminopimelate epimerase [Donghicola sp. C2-DW-16]|uniref:Diaminopimelate epimerase n=1 Tax=Donghicola mangrovi TaxID=2729614 RepID=A0ABX2PB47_9RHOB|nr:diaminopimelate epimerase [Donghicola mangrovi]NVO26242.1 diaminopimelate epimerase [Donghicola mangrovi]